MNESGVWERAYRPTPRKVVHDTIDGEVIVIQLERGVYFSLGGTAAELWELLASGRSPAEATDALADHYDADRERVAAGVETVISRLLADAVLVPDDAPVNRTPMIGPVSGEFDDPQIERYDDMEDFLLIDPIHEVADTGWPQRGPTA